MADLSSPEQPTNQQTFFTPVELKSLAQSERQRHKGPQGFSLLATTRAGEGGQLAVTALVALRLDLLDESLSGSKIVLCSKRIGFKCLLPNCVERVSLLKADCRWYTDCLVSEALIHFRMVFLSSRVRLAI